MIEIALGVGLFIAILLTLVAIILVARIQLSPKGEVEIVVNGAKTLTAPLGVKLLAALSEAGIQLPSACGGVGTCGQCRLRVLDGGGAPLPIELAQIGRRATFQGTRLACQVVVRQAMTVEVPDEVFGVREWSCIVRSNNNIGTLIKELILDLPAGEHIDFRAGGYVLVTCPPYEVDFADFDIGAGFHGEWDRLGLWGHRAGTHQPTTRAYSLANQPAENDRVMLNVRLAIPPPGAHGDVPAGIVSSYLFSLRSGDELTIAGPYGHFFATEGEAEMIFIGGGVGMAPMRSHILDQLENRKSRRKISFWYGARTARELLYRETFDRLAQAHDHFTWHIALSDPDSADNWQGPVGFIHDVLHDEYLSDHPAPEACEYYLCGPPMMTEAVINMLDSLGIDRDNIFFDDFGS
ncbi:MAG: NADH:ubiquinone reductase (Na(+)-transporting) subunit F [Alphaproteobacteria bacterium]|nr:NADH:ubiquinone reductase (Na(+)-transporting) subunit F [Alphaproteobacteria bacterium]